MSRTIRFYCIAPLNIYLICVNFGHRVYVFFPICYARVFFVHWIQIGLFFYNLPPLLQFPPFPPQSSPPPLFQTTAFIALSLDFASASRITLWILTNGVAVQERYTEVGNGIVDRLAELGKHGPSIAIMGRRNLSPVPHQPPWTSGRLIFSHRRLLQ